MRLLQLTAIAAVTAMLLTGCGGGGGGSHGTAIGSGGSGSPGGNVGSGGSSGSGAGGSAGGGSSGSGSGSGSGGSTGGGSSGSGTGGSTGSGSGGSGGSSGGSTGGGSSGGSGNSVTVYLKGADWAAYSASPWQVIDINSLGTDKTFTFQAASDGKYGVAIHCKDAHLWVYQATVSELPAVSVCDDDTEPTFTVSGQISNISGQTVTVELDGDSQWVSAGGSVANYTLTEVEKGVSDLVALDMEVVDYTTFKPKKIAIVRDVNVDRNITGLNADFAKGHDFVEHTMNITGDGTGQVSFISKNGTDVNIAMINGQNANNSWYALASGTKDGDIYAFSANNQIVGNNQSKIIYETKSATSDPGNVTYDPTVIADYDVTAQRDNGIFFDNVKYTKSSASPAVRWYEFDLFRDDDDKTDWHVSVTPGWLGAATSYALPNYEGLAGWQSDWSLKNNETIDWHASVYMTNRSILQDESNYRTAGLLIHIAWTGGELAAE